MCMSNCLKKISNAKEFVCATGAEGVLLPRVCSGPRLELCCGDDVEDTLRLLGAGCQPEGEFTRSAILFN